MSKILFLLLGLVFAALGIFVIITHWAQLVTVFWGALGITLLLIGVLTAIIAISEFTAKSKE